MIFLSRKNGHIGELRVIVTELDRAEMLISGSRQINIDDVINQFNKDPDITSVTLTAAYAGDLKDEKLSEFIENLNNAVAADKASKQDNKEKVTPVGKIVNNKDDDEIDDDEGDPELQEVLSEYDLTCKACGDKDKALVDIDGNIHSCESCIKIDAYIKGKKEGFEEGYEQGYSECLKHLKKLASEDIKVTEPDNKETKKDD